MNEITHGFHNPLNNGGDCYSIKGKITIFNHSYKGNVKTFHNQKHAYINLKGNKGDLSPLQI